MGKPIFFPGEWRLHPDIVQAIWGCFSLAQVDHFASQETTHCPWWYSMVCPKGTLGVEALAFTWPQALLYAFPPFPLLPAVLARGEDVAGHGAFGGPRLASSALDGGPGDIAGGNHLVSPGPAGPALAGAGPAVASKPKDLQVACLI